MNGYFITGIAAGVLGIATGGAGVHYTLDATELAKAQKSLSVEQAAHAHDNEQAAVNLKAVSDTAAQAAQVALATQTKMQQANDAAQTAIAKLQGENNAIDSKYRASLAAGTQRVRVAVTNCQANDSAGGSGKPDDSQSAGRQPDTASTAELDPAVASRVFGVAADDQQQIDRYVRLQAWACTVKPDAPGCQK